MSRYFSNFDYILEPLLINVPYQRFQAGELMRFLGTNDSRPKVRHILEETVERLQDTSFTDLLNVQVRLSIVSARKAGKRKVELSGFMMHCNTWFFNGAEGAALTVMTTGAGAEEEENRLFNAGRRFDALVLRALAAASMERGMQVIRKKLRQDLNPAGMCLGYDISPGCQDIPLATQKIILELVHAEEIGVTLNDYFIMKPANSVTNIVPLGKNLTNVSMTGSTCQVCNMGSRCSYRKRV